MKKSIDNMLRKLGVDKAVFYFLIGKGFFYCPPLTLYLIASRFTSSEQGYYYTFGSLKAFQYFLNWALAS